LILDELDLAIQATRDRVTSRGYQKTVSPSIS